MNRKLALFLFSLGLATSAAADGRMDEFACREWCQTVEDECRANGEGNCALRERQCYMECMAY